MVKSMIPAIFWQRSSSHADKYSVPFAIWAARVRSTTTTRKATICAKHFCAPPVEFTRISSRFNLRRRHPVLNRIRAHKGVDYAAAKGTPVRATGNGKIRFMGTQRGCVRVIVVQHQQKYTTLIFCISTKKLSAPRPLSKARLLATLASLGWPPVIIYTMSFVSTKFIVTRSQ